jgi:hypothetical protein
MAAVEFQLTQWATDILMSCGIVRVKNALPRGSEAR